MEFRHLLASATACALGVGSADSAGVAVFKEQVYHLDSSAVAAAYSRIISFNGPHVRLVIGGRNHDVLRSKLIACVELPDSIPPVIQSDGDLQPLRGALAALEEFAVRYPRSAPLLEKNIDVISRHIGRFEAGLVRYGGVWMSRDEMSRIAESRKREQQATDLAEVEKRVFEASQRDKGLVLHDGKWMTRQEREQYPPHALAELGECIVSLWSGDLEGARIAVANLTKLASRQTGAPKVRTERLATAVHNLYLAEFGVTRQMVVNSRDHMRAAALDRSSREWLKPNAFGTIHTDVAREARSQAMAIREQAASGLALRRQELLGQLHEIEIVASDFEKLKEVRVVLILGAAVRAVASRHFTGDEFRSSFPDESMAAIRSQLRSGQAASPTL